MRRTIHLDALYRHTWHGFNRHNSVVSRNDSPFFLFSKTSRLFQFPSEPEHRQIITIRKTKISRTRTFHICALIFQNGIDINPFSLNTKASHQFRKSHRKCHISCRKITLPTVIRIDGSVSIHQSLKQSQSLFFRCAKILPWNVLVIPKVGRTQKSNQPNNIAIIHSPRTTYFAERKTSIFNMRTQFFDVICMRTKTTVC